jgi:hypothetical protein
VVYRSGANDPKQTQCERCLSILSMATRPMPVS